MHRGYISDVLELRVESIIWYIEMLMHSISIWRVTVGLW